VSSSRRPSVPPAATSMQILAGDLLARACRIVADEAPLSGEHRRILRSALDVYASARIGDAIATIDDPQRCDVARWDEPPAPETERSVSHG